MEKTIVTQPKEPLNPIIIPYENYEDKVDARYELLDYTINYKSASVVLNLKETLIAASGRELRSKPVRIIKENKGAQVQFDVDEHGEIVEGTEVTIKAAESPVSDFINTKTGDKTISEAGMTMIGGMINDYLAGLR